MRKLTLFLATILCACLAIAQVPQTMNFQALIRNAENEVVTNQQVDVEVRVLNASQTAVYVETHSVTTSSGGVATMEIGAGTPVSGSFAAIDWAAGRYYLETRIQLPDGSDALTDVSPLLSVPYSLYAAKAGEVDIDLSEYAKKSDIPEAVDLSDYALKSEIPSEVSLEEYAKKSEIPAMPDLSGYALKSEIPAEVDLTDYAKSADIESAYAKKTDLDGYALVSQIPAEVDLTDYAKSADIESAYAKKTDLNGYALVSQIPDEVDLTDYAKSADIESAYAKKTDLDGYALVSQIPDEVDLTDYAKSADIESAYAKKTDLSGYALVSQIPEEVDLTDYALKSELPTVPDVTGFATKTEVSENYLTKETFENYVLGAGQPESVDLSVYAKTADVNAALATLEAQIPDEVDLTDYAKSADIESAYAKKTDLNGYALVSQIPAEVDLTDYAKSADIESAYAKKTDLNGYALVSQIPEEVDLTDYVKSADIESAYAKKTDLNNYALVLQIPDEVDLTDYAKSADIESAYAKKTDLNNYALVSQIPDEVDLTDYAKSADIESAYAKKTALNEYTKSGANISVFVNDVEYVKKSYVDSLFNVLKAQIAAIPNGGGNGGNGGETGKIDAKFSVAADKQVYFSKGNLQYQASTKTWRFAENQYDIVGADNENISSSNTGWIDLFGYGTSGYGDCHPYNSGQYDSYPNSYSVGQISETNYDWGYYNKISNGGGQAGLWRTLTGDEWTYLFSSRTNAENLYGAAQVNGVSGVVVLPDDWTLPEGVSFTKGFNGTSLYELNVYSTADWAKMEENGAVFLPAVGYRLGTTVNDAGEVGYYWSAIEDKSVQFSGESIRTDYMWQRSNGQGVRVVQDAE
ncbi:MAG: hypothetical protein II926_00765 [Bacteroidales bacterium]|nr:hypothetical protein [Bacteroidales bacterium]